MNKNEIKEADGHRVVFTTLLTSKGEPAGADLYLTKLDLESIKFHEVRSSYIKSERHSKFMVYEATPALIDLMEVEETKLSKVEKFLKMEKAFGIVPAAFEVVGSDEGYSIEEIEAMVSDAPMHEDNQHLSDEDLVAKINKDYNDNQLLLENGDEGGEPRFFTDFTDEDGALIIIEMTDEFPSLEGIDELRYEAKYWGDGGVTELGSVTGTMYSPANMIQVIRNHIEKVYEFYTAASQATGESAAEIDEIWLTLKTPTPFVCYIKMPTE